MESHKTRKSKCSKPNCSNPKCSKSNCSCYIILPGEKGPTGPTGTASSCSIVSSNGTPIATMCDPIITTGLVVKELFGTDIIAALAENIPVLGPGSRLTWDKNAGSFRAGGVLATQWDNQGQYSAAFGFNNSALSSFSFSEGFNNTSSGTASHSEGLNTLASGFASHSEGQMTQATGTGTHAEGIGSVATGTGSHVEGNNNISSGIGTHAEGNNTIASAVGAHSEGSRTTAFAIDSHAEGSDNIASGTGSHVEGINNFSTNLASHAEGRNTRSSGEASHSEGLSTIANRIGSHAGGIESISSDVGQFSRAGGGFATQINGKGATGIGTAQYSMYYLGLQTENNPNVPMEILNGTIRPSIPENTTWSIFAQVSGVTVNGGVPTALSSIITNALIWRTGAGAVIDNQNSTEIGSSPAGTAIINVTFDKVTILINPTIGIGDTRWSATLHVNSVTF